ncbi:Rrf2 family transcriptional regulator [Streptomyces sp. SID10853]|uniref:RrF2 family transcriptional regulator n=1 Tax=Streptomyces sp. SID10853 TaxID=2706028 RepID=UPI001EF2E1DB|nr:Rrf2 family transcriptional regulator [Streptomyces sp. SID10853]
MRMHEGVEWALHSCLNLAWAGPEHAVPAARLAAYHDLPAAYLNKQLQALARAGIVSSVPGPRGGFRLARRPEDVTVMDVVAAIEGSEHAFRCAEIRQQGPGAGMQDSYRDLCTVSQAMRRAELAWRRELAGQTLADIKATAERTAPGVPARVSRWFADARA